MPHPTPRGETSIAGYESGSVTCHLPSFSVFQGYFSCLANAVEKIFPPGGQKRESKAFCLFFGGGGGGGGGSGMMGGGEGVAVICRCGRRLTGKRYAGSKTLSRPPSNFLHMQADPHLCRHRDRWNKRFPPNFLTALRLNGISCRQFRMWRQVCA